jgi:hypothetical protein
MSDRVRKGIAASPRGACALRAISRRPLVVEAQQEATAAPGLLSPVVGRAAHSAPAEELWTAYALD